MSRSNKIADLIDSNGDIKSTHLDNAPATDISGKADKTDLNTTNEKVTSLAFRQAVDHSDVKYNLASLVIDEFVDSSGIDTSASQNEVIAGGKCTGLATATTTYDINGTGSDQKDGSLQTHTVSAGISELTIEAWGGRGGASTNSWKKNESGTLDNTSSTPGTGEAGGYTVRLKGTYSGFNGGETLKIAVGKAGTINSGADHGCHTGGGGASWVLLDHGSSSTIGQTRGVANNKQYTPLLVAGGGGGAGTRHGYTYNQDADNHTYQAESDANTATANGATRTGTVYSSTSPEKYGTGTDDGEGGTASTGGGSYYAGGGGAGFLANGSDSGVDHESYGGSNSQGKHPFDSSNPFYGGTSGNGAYGDASGGYGGGGAGNLSGGGGGGGYSGGSSHGVWSNAGQNGIGGGSLFGSTVSIGGGYTNAISVTENTNTLADDSDVSPVTNGRDGRVIISEVSNPNVTLQSTATTASSAPTKATLMVGYKNTTGTATINTDIKGYVSRDGANFTEVTLVDKGSIGDYNLLTVHDATITSASGTSMKWKVTTHNQTNAKLTEVHAVSLGWK